MKVIIIGANGAGMTCAAKLKRNLPQATITIFENSQYISFGACGLPYFVGDFFNSEKDLFAKTQTELEKQGLVININHEVLSINHKKKNIDVKNLTNSKTFQAEYDKLIIATGATSINLGLNSSNNISTLKTMDDANKIKQYLHNNKVQNIAILGAGFIGLELLEAFLHFASKHKQQYNIHLIDFKQHITNNLLDSEFEEILQNEISQYKNIKLYLNTAFEKVEQGKTLKIHVKNNATNKTSTLTADLLILSLGFKPQFPKLNESQFNLLENGAIHTNKNGETNIKDIYAIGDCASVFHKILGKEVYIPLATTANKLGRKVADTIANKSNSFDGSLGSSCLKLLNLEIAKTGITEYEANKYNIPYKPAFITDYNHPNYYPNQEKLFMKVLYCPNSRKILGGQIVGKNSAMLRIHALTVAIHQELLIDDLTNLDFAYAPPFTRTWEALNVLGMVASKSK